MDSIKKELAALAGAGGILGAGLLCRELLFLGQRPKPHGIPILVCWGVASVGVVVASASYMKRRQRIEDSTEDSKDELPTSLQDDANIRIDLISGLDEVMPMLDQIRLKQEENNKNAELRDCDILKVVKEKVSVMEKSNSASARDEANNRQYSVSLMELLSVLDQVKAEQVGSGNQTELRGNNIMMAFQQIAAAMESSNAMPKNTEELPESILKRSEESRVNDAFHKWLQEENQTREEAVDCRSPSKMETVDYSDKE